MLLYAMFFDDLLYHGFILPHIAVEETVLQPNELRDERNPDLGGRTRSVWPPNQGAQRSGVLPAGQDFRSIEVFCGAQRSGTAQWPARG